MLNLRVDRRKRMFMIPPAFLVTVDTEGDNLWDQAGQITLDNVRCLPRFQEACERHGLKPTYLTDYHMARNAEFRRFAADVLRRGAGEVGAHPHAWDTPPLEALTADDLRHRPYLMEYAAPVMRAKIAYLTSALEDAFGRKMTSHRAGRWAFNGEYARALLEYGYTVDCSVTPGFSWRGCMGDPNGSGGPDYSLCPSEPYFVDVADIRRPGRSGLLEVPFTIVPTCPPPLVRMQTALPFGSAVRSALNRLCPPIWLRPNGRNGKRMVRAAQIAARQRRPFIELMLHSSELMPGGSPYLPDEASIERLYADIESLFSEAGRRFKGATLTGFAQDYTRRRAGAEAAAANSGGARNG